MSSGLQRVRCREPQPVAERIDLIEIERQYGLAIRRLCEQALAEGVILGTQAVRIGAQIGRDAAATGARMFKAGAARGAAAADVGDETDGPAARDRILR